MENAIDLHTYFMKSAHANFSLSLAPNYQAYLSLSFASYLHFDLSLSLTLQNFIIGAKYQGIKIA